MQSTGTSNVEVVQLDLANIENIQKFAEDIKERISEIDCLVCNAGVWYPMDLQAKTDDGFEANVGVNHLGHFLLTNLLLGKVKRVVIVSSGLMMSGKVDVEDSRQFIDGRKVQEGERVPKHAPLGYCDSKLMNAIFARDLAQRHLEIPVVCVGPGWCKTELARNVPFPWYKKVLLAPIAFLFMRSSKEGAQNIMHAVLEDADNLRVLKNKFLTLLYSNFLFFSLQSGYFYRDFQLAQRENTKVDGLMEISSQLWSLSEEVTKLKN